MNNYTGESEGAENTLELREGVANLRKCSFRPEHYFVRIPGFHDGDEESYYLEVKWREFWFHCYCDENNIQDRAIEELPVTLIAGTSFLQAESHVTMNGKIVGRGVGGYCISENDMNYAVQIASTIAKGRALANAGFGTVFSSAKASENGGKEIPCDAGIRTSEFYVKRHPGNPMHVVAEDTHTSNDDGKPVSQNSGTPVMQNADPSIVMTRDEALRYKVQIRGKHFGEALGDVMGKDPKAVKYYAENPRYAGNDLQTAARLVLSQ